MAVRLSVFCAVTVIVTVQMESKYQIISFYDELCIVMVSGMYLQNTICVVVNAGV
jgi:hypothetical protein